MGKFWQISTELWPLIDVRNWFHSLSLAFLYRFSLKLGMRVDIGGSGWGGLVFTIH